MRVPRALETYRGKRDFRRTPEPPGRLPRGSKRLSFCVQKHDATRLHYDFRLELRGVLKSWAVPKGPCLDSAEKRLAVHVEDHPIDYGGFEGVIPPGEYGAGTVLLWDRGSWIPEGDPEAGYARGSLHFTLQGEKLRGRWNLFRMSRGVRDDGKENWLLQKAPDEAAMALSEGDVLRLRPESVRSARSRLGRASAPRRGRSDPIRLPGARPSPLPETLEVQRATLVDRPPEGPGWLHEIKFDGYRIVARLERGVVQFRTRNGKDWTRTLADLADEVRSLPLREAFLDGELIVEGPEGASSFGALQEALSGRPAGPLLYCVFDLLYADGYDLRRVPLFRRKEFLSGVMARAPRGRLRYVDHVEGHGEAFHREACRHALEGVVSKRKDGAHHPGRGMDWVKVKCERRQEFVVGGFTDPEGTRSGFGALLLGFHESGTFRYAGRVGTGFTETVLRDLHARLAPLERTDPPFDPPPRGPEARGVHWVEPRMVVEVSFGHWTRDGRLRHPVYQGMRDDKRPRDVGRERARPATRLARRASPSGDEVAGVRLTHPDRVFYPGPGITKRELALFTAEIAPWILPHVAGRPLSLLRCPGGQSKPCFVQKHVRERLPDAIRRVVIEESEGPAEYLVVDDAAGLVSLVQMGVLEIHPWGSRAEDVDRPDRCILDLDPAPDVPWGRVVEAARLVGALLKKRGLESFVKTTGGKGLHLVLPLSGRPDWAAVKSFSKGIADDLARAAPDAFTSTLSKAARPGRIFVDYLRNSRGATAVAAYSTRARPAAPVSTPVSWKELDDSLRSDQFTVRNLRERLAGLSKDPWKGFSSLRQRLP